MARLPIPALALSLTLVLAGCGGDRKQEGAGKAEGEVLPGSVSDAMLPLDTVKSQPPLDPRSEGSGKAEDKKASDRPKAAAEPAEPAAEPEPAVAAEE
jgi:hypothetical protein